MFVPDNSRRSSSFGSFKIIELKWGIEKNGAAVWAPEIVAVATSTLFKVFIGSFKNKRLKLSLSGAVVPSNWATLTPNNNSILSIE